MLSTPLIAIAGELCGHDLAEVYLTQKVSNLLLFNWKASKGLSGRTLLAGGVIGKHVAEKPALPTPMLYLRTVSRLHCIEGKTHHS